MRSIEFMRQMGYLGPLAPEVDLMTRFPDDAARASYEKKAIWPEGKMPDAQPHQVAKMTNEKGNSAAPYIDWLPAPEKPNGCCMILISGGAYKNCCDVGLVDMWGKKFTAAGFQCVNLVCRTPRRARAATPGSAASGNS